MNFVKSLLHFLFHRLLLSVLILGLLTSNVLTLFNSNFHDRLYGALADVVPTSWSRNSPASRKSVQDKKIAKITKSTNKVSKRVSKRAATGAIKNVGGAAAEAVPILGLVTIVALTVSDVNDACEDMKDMHELRTALELESDMAEVDRVCGMEVPTVDELKADVRNKWSQWWDDLFTLVSDLL